MNAECDRVTWREFVVHGVLCLLILALLFPGVFLRGELAVPWRTLYHIAPWSQYVPDGVQAAPNRSAAEPITQVYYWYKESADALRNGEWPLWNPHQYAGMPLLANMQSAVFYPPRLLHAFMDHFLATSILILLKAWLCGMTAYWCGRGIGFSVSGARFLGVAWMLAMYNMVWIYWPVPDVAAWMPVLFLGVERILRSCYRSGFYCIAFGGTLILFAGHPETAFAFGLGLGAYFLVRLALERRTGRRLVFPILVAAAAWIPALLLAAVQLAPFIEYIVNSYTYQSRSGAAHSGHQLFSRGLICFWVPRFFGASVEGNFWGLKDEAVKTFLGQRVGNTNHVSYVYVGVVTWVVAVASLPLIRRDSVARNRIVAFCIAGVLGLLLALDHPVVRFLQTLPLMAATVKTYHVSFLLFALIVAGAQGIHLFQAHGFNRKQLRILALISGVIAAFIVLTWMFERPGIDAAGVGAYVDRQILVALAFGAAACAFLMVCKRHGMRRVGATLLVVLCAADLLIASSGIRSTVSRSELQTTPPIYATLQQHAAGERVMLWTAGMLPGASQYYGAEMLLGYDAIMPERFWHMYRSSGPYWDRMQDAVGATYAVFLGAMDAGPFEPVAEADGYTLHRNARSLPRAYLVGHVRAVENKDAVLAAMAGPEFDPTRTVVTEAPPESPLPSNSLSDVGRAVVIERTWNRVVVEAAADESAALVLTDTFYPGWTVWIDGERAELFPANYAFRGTVIPAGQHRVEFRYEPASFKAGLAISVVTGFVAIAAGLLMLARRRNTA